MGNRVLRADLELSEKKTDLTKQKEAFVKRNNASYALFGFSWVFMVLIIYHLIDLLYTPTYLCNNT